MSKARDLADLPQGSGDLYVDGDVGIGTSSPSSANALNKVLNIDVSSSEKAGISLSENETNRFDVFFDGSDNSAHLYNSASGGMRFYGTGSERMRIDSSGNLLVGQSSSVAPGSGNVEGFAVGSSGYISASRASNPSAEFNRKTSDGDIAVFRKDGTAVGSIGNIATDRLYITVDDSGGDAGLAFDGDSSTVYPCTSTGTSSDNTTDLGRPSSRFDDIYATNGTIQTSDRNEKQDIASLTSIEMNVAKRISAMFKKFRWIDSVTEKGDAARTHNGVIAQDVQQAFTDEGLDAGDYALFISTTWWETQTDVPAVEAVGEVLDDDGNVVTEAVEAKDAYTRTDTYNTLGEAPEGATKRTRMGIRYPQLLSFLAAYNEQRFSAIEARLDALEV